MSEQQASIQPTLIPEKPEEIPSWKALYEKTIWEADTEKLLTLIHATEAALYLRWQEIDDSAAHQPERAAMEAAAKELLAVKVHKLGWPDPCT
jgi:hypothetical protein